MTVKFFVVSFITEFIVRILMLYSFTGFYGKKIKCNLKKIITILLTCTIISLNSYYNLFNLKIFLTFALITITTKVVFEIKLFDAIKVVLLYAITSISIEILLSILFVITKIDSFILLNEYLLLKFLFSIMEILLVILILTNKKIIKSIKKIDYLLKTKKDLKYLLLISFVVMSILLIVLSKSLNDLYIISLSIIIAILLVIIINMYINFVYNIEVLKEKNVILKESYKANNYMVEEYRFMKHNLYNELVSLDIVLPKKYHSTLKSLINKYNSNSNIILDISNIPDGLLGVIFLKQKEAEKHKIDFYVDSNCNFTGIEEDYIELCNCISILIDNSIEACKSLKKSAIAISLKNYNNVFEFTIRNNYANTININSIGKKNYSTKQVKSGLGLFYLNKKSNNNLKTSFKIIDNLFEVKLLYIKK